jgi:hypothetical protein
VTALSPRARLSRPPSRNCFCHLAIVVWLIWSRRAISTWVISPLSTLSTIASFSVGRKPFKTPDLEHLLDPLSGSQSGVSKKV